MPNHWHAIVCINSNKIPYIRNICENTNVNTQKNELMQNFANKQGWLSVVIGGIKSAVTKFANSKGIDFAWQTRFHDHIIRNPYQMKRIDEYITNNVANWNADCFNRDIIM